MYVTTTLTSTGVGGTSRAINLDWMNGSPTGLQVTTTSTTFAYTVQTTLYDILLTASSLVVWQNDPAITAATSVSSGIVTYTAPIAGIRINSSASTSGVFTIQVLQPVL